MIKTQLLDYKGNDVYMSSPQMEKDFISAKEEISRTLGYNLLITSAGRTEEEDKEAKKKYGFSGGQSHIKGEALDITVRGIQAFHSGGHTPTEQGLKAANEIKQVLEKYGFKWAGNNDIVHFSYTKAHDYNSTLTELAGPKNNETGNQAELFFRQFDKLSSNLNKLNGMSNSKIEKIGAFLLNVGKGKLKG